MNIQDQEFMLHLLKDLIIFKRIRRKVGVIDDSVDPVIYAAERFLDEYMSDWDQIEYALKA